MADYTDELDLEFEPEYGFFDTVRNDGIFDEAKAERYFAVLSKVSLTADTIEIKLARLLWSLPILLQFQGYRAARNDDEFLAAQLFRSAKTTHATIARKFLDQASENEAQAGKILAKEKRLIAMAQDELKNWSSRAPFEESVPMESFFTFWEFPFSMQCGSDEARAAGKQKRLLKQRN